MKRLTMKSRDVVGGNVEKIAALFPHCVTERRNKDGKLELAIDFDKLRAELSNEVLEDGEERYQFTWPDKRAASRLANEPTTMTLRPCREESVDFDTTENLYIEGDNLDVLKVLRETYLGKVKMIYIDPPYNTGNDFVYNDDFAQGKDEFEQTSGLFDEEGNQIIDPMQRNTESNGRFHTDWLNMIYPRLKVARDLLAEDGIVFISIDDNELENLRKVCDEIFGQPNFVTNIIWQSTAGSNTGTDIVTVTENIIVYTKNRKSFCFDGRLSDEESFTLSDEYVRERGCYALDKLDRRRVGNHYSSALDFGITMPDGTIRFPGGTTSKSSEGWNYLWSKAKIEWGIKNHFIVFKNKDGQWSVYCKRYQKVDNEGRLIERSAPFRNLITADKYNTAQGTAEIRSIFNGRPFDFPKPSELIKHLLLTAVRTSKEAIILDFFSGSATTAHAVMKLNAEDGGHRKFIMVQLPEVTDEKSEARKAGYENICEIGEERIRRAGKRILEEVKKARSEKGVVNSAEENTLFSDTENYSLQTPHSSLPDIGFRVLKLDSSNMEDVYYTPDNFDPSTFDSLIDNIKADRTGEDLLFQVMLSLGIELSSKIERKQIAGKEVFSVDNDFLLACFDSEVNETTIEEMAKLLPTHLVIRDASAANDNVLDNFDQIIQSYSSEQKITTHIL